MYNLIGLLLILTAVVISFSGAALIIFLVESKFKKALVAFIILSISMFFLSISMFSAYTGLIKQEEMRNMDKNVNTCINDSCDKETAIKAKNHIIHSTDSLNNLIVSIKNEIDKNNNILKVIDNNTSIKYNVQVKSSDNTFDITVTGKGKNISDTLIPHIADSTKPLINSIKNNI